MTISKSKDLKTISNNKYKLGDEFAEGAYSKVYNCDNEKSKVVKITPLSDKYYAINEINILKSIEKNKLDYFKKYNIQKSNIVSLEDYYISSNYIYSIFNKCSTDLYHFQKDYIKYRGKQLPNIIIQKIISEILNGIRELNNSNIIHCDIKLNNVLICFNKKINNYVRYLTSNKFKLSEFVNMFEVKLIDFNKSHYYDQVYMSHNIQTINFQAPEITYRTKYDETIDLWSICNVFWLLAKNEFLFDIYKENNEIFKNNANNGLYPESDSESDSDSDSDHSHSKRKSYEGNSTGDSDYYNDHDEFENYIYVTYLHAYLDEPLPSSDYDPHVPVQKINLQEKLSNNSYFLLFYKEILKKIFILDPKKRIKINEVIKTHNEIISK